jgi:hypothetical protein
MPAALGAVQRPTASFRRKMFKRPNCPDDAATMNPAGLNIADGDNNPSKSEAFHFPSPRRDGPARVHTTDETGSTAIQQPFA